MPKKAKKGLATTVEKKKLAAGLSKKYLDAVAKLDSDTATKLKAALRKQEGVD